MNASIVRGKLCLLEIVKKIQSLSPRARAIFFCSTVIVVNLIRSSSTSDPSSSRQISTIINDSMMLPSICIVNNGKAVAHDRDPKFTKEMNGIIEQFKHDYDAHEMPDIEVIEPSFYFQTTTPFGIPEEKHYPALSRAWNGTYAVTDDKTITDNGGEYDGIWGSRGLDDEYIQLAMNPNSGHPSSNIVMLPPGKNYIAYSGWYFGNFGHYVHDHLSKLAWLKQLVSDDDNTMFILPYHEVHERVLTVVDEGFVRNRVIWIKYGETVSANSASLTVMIPKSNMPFPGGYPQTATVYTEYLRLWLEESHWRGEDASSRNKRKVIYYMRRGSTPRRNVDQELESVILSKIREAMVKRGQNPEEDLIIFNGLDENGETLSMQTQFDLFSSADTAIGPHGSGLTNIIWMDPRCSSGGSNSKEDRRPKVLEFVSSKQTPSIQTGSFWGYWFLYGSLPWIDYHQMYYTADSTDPQTFIDPEIFQSALNLMWGIK